MDDGTTRGFLSDVEQAAGGRPINQWPGAVGGKESNLNHGVTYHHSVDLSIGELLALLEILEVSAFPAEDKTLQFFDDLIRLVS